MAELSLSAYARSRKERGLSGGSLGNVQTAIKYGRIKLTPNGKIDPEQADIDWAANTDKAKDPTKGLAAKLKKGGAPAQEAVAHTKDLADFAKARSVKEVFGARMAQLDYELRSGKLVSTEEVADRWGHIVSITRTRLLGVPSKIRQTMPSISKEDIKAIDALIREALDSLTTQQSDAEGIAPDDDAA